MGIDIHSDNNMMSVEIKERRMKERKDLNL